MCASPPTASFGKRCGQTRSICESPRARRVTSAQAGSVFRSRGYLLVTGSGRNLPARPPYQFHFPLRTHPKVRHATGTTTASPLAKVTGQRPGLGKFRNLLLRR